MNLLYLTSRLPSETGTGVSVLDYARAAVDGNHRVQVLHIEAVAGGVWPKTTLRKVEREGIPVTSVVISSRFHRSVMGTTPLMNLLARRYYLEQVHPVFKVDLVHAHNAWQSGAMAWALHRMHDLPYVLSEADTDPEWYFGGAWSYIPGRVYREAERVLAATPVVRERLLHHEPDLERVELMELTAGSGTLPAGWLHRIYGEAAGFVGDEGHGTVE